MNFMLHMYVVLDRLFCCGGADFLRLKYLIHVMKNTFFPCLEQLNRYSELSM